MATKPDKTPLTLAIVGGGITGLTLAISLLRRGVPCTLYEQAACFREIGAGLGFHAGAVEALRICSPDVFAAYERVRTVNAWDSKEDVWFDVLDGTAQVDAKELRPAFTLYQRQKGWGAVHRARFLDELVAVMEREGGRAEFGKRVEGMEEVDGGVQITFADGTVATAAAVVGCDGIKSKTREILLGSDRLAEAKCGYSGKYAYRCLIPMEKAVEALGEEKAANTSLWMGPNCHVLTFPISNGQIFNLVAFVTDEKDWPDKSRLTLPATKEEILHDYRNFGPNVKKLISMIDEKPDRWGLFDLAANPLPTYTRGRICLAGDAAHASTPHHGAGAGVSIEDVAVLAELLTDDSVRGPEDLENVFRVYDESRRERTQWLVQSSRRAADIYEWRAEYRNACGRMADECHERQGKIWEHDLRAEIEEARRKLRS